MREIKFRAWLIKENEMVVPSSINYNRGYGGALEIFVDNPKFEPYRDIIEAPGVGILPFFTYINHSMDVHKEQAQGDDFELMQYTGLKDKNGKEIYEGDMVNFAVNERLCDICDDELKLGISKFCPSCGKKVTTKDFITTAKIVFNNGGFAYHYSKNEDYYQEWQTCISEVYIKWKEVIGNIHENPELLKT